MLTFKYNGQDVTLDFTYGTTDVQLPHDNYGTLTRRQTTTAILNYDGREYKGMAFKHPKDKDNKVEGRRQALTNLFAIYFQSDVEVHEEDESLFVRKKDEAYEFRDAVWRAYHFPFEVRPKSLTLADLAKDVITLLNLKKIEAHKGTYCALPDDMESGEPLQIQLQSTTTPCDACAKGALFLAYVDKENKVLVPRDLGDLDGEEAVTEPIIDAGIATQDELDLIEQAFEGWPSSKHDFISLKMEYPNDEERLRLIMNNIISNGKLVPEQLFQGLKVENEVEDKGVVPTDPMDYDWMCDCPSCREFRGEMSDE